LQAITPELLASFAAAGATADDADEAQA